MIRWALFIVGVVPFVVMALMWLTRDPMQQHVDTAPIDIPPIEPQVSPDFVRFVADIIAQAYADTTIYRRLYRLPGETTYPRKATPDTPARKEHPWTAS